MADDTYRGSFCGSLRRICGSKIFRAFHRAGGAAENLTSILSKELDTHKPIKFKKDIFHYLSLYETYPHHFLHVILNYDRQNVAANLYQLESFIENNHFIGLMSSFRRELVDQVISYEKQNTRAYLYYLTVKARVKEKEPNNTVNSLTDRDKYDFSFEKIFAKIKDNMYEMGNVISFVEYSAASPFYELNQLIKAKIYSKLYFETLKENLEALLASIKSGVDPLKVDAFMNLRKFMKLIEKNQVEGFFFLPDTIRSVERKITRLRDRIKEKERESAKIDQLKSLRRMGSTKKSEGSTSSREQSPLQKKSTVYENESSRLMPIRELPSRFENHSFITMDNSDDHSKKGANQTDTDEWDQEKVKQGFSKSMVKQPVANSQTRAKNK